MKARTKVRAFYRGKTELYGKLEKQAKSVGRVTFSKMTKEQVELAYDFMLAKEAVERTKRQLEENQAPAGREPG